MNEVVEAIEAMLRRGIVIYTDEQQQVHIRLEGEGTARQAEKDPGLTPEWRPVSNTSW